MGAFAQIPDYIDSGLLVYIGMIGQASGLLLKNQIMLRLLVLLGSLFYIWYYFVHPAEPLWGAIWASSAIVAANLIGLGRVLYAKAPLGMNAQQRALYEMMAGLSPGDFRRLMKQGEICTTKTEELLTEEGTRPEHLFFVMSGMPQGQKCGQAFSLPVAHFIGEISLILGCTASATVRLPAGGRYVRWERKRLSRALASSPPFERAFEALLARDMARKVASSIQLSKTAPNLTLVA